MKIILISPFGGIHALGIRYLSSVLKKNRHETKLVFLPRLLANRGDFDNIKSFYLPGILDDLQKICYGADLIGISVMTNYFFRSVEITRFLKNKFKIPIIWGGIHPTVEPDESLKYADLICRGEGEEAFLELANKIQNHKKINSIENIWIQDNDRIIKNKLRPLNNNLNEIPFPDYDLKSHYILNNNRIVLMSRNIFKASMPRILDKKGNSLVAYPVFCTRGCPHSCSYCCNNALRTLYHGQRYVRRRSVENIILELKNIIKIFPFIKAIRIEDDSFLVSSTKDIHEFCREYKNEINLPFICLTSPINVNQDKIANLVEAGLIGIQLGIQSGSDMLNKRVFNRNIPAREVLRATKIIYKYRAYLTYPRYDIITDNPWEKKSDLVKTIRLLSRIPGKYILNVYSLVFYPGTAIFNRALKEEILESREKLYIKDWLRVKMTYLKFLIFINRFSTFKLSAKCVDFLLKPKMIRFGEKFNFLYNSIYSLIYFLRLRMPF